MWDVRGTAAMDYGVVRVAAKDCRMSKGQTQKME